MGQQCQLSIDYWLPEIISQITALYIYHTAVNKPNHILCKAQCSTQSGFLHDSRTNNPIDPQNRKQGVKNDPLPFLLKSQSFGPHKQNSDISHDIEYQEL